MTDVKEAAADTAGEREADQDASMEDAAAADSGIEGLNLKDDSKDDADDDMPPLQGANDNDDNDNKSSDDDDDDSTKKKDETSPTDDKPKTDDDYLCQATVFKEEGNDLFKKGDYDDAARKYRKGMNRLNKIKIT